MRVHPAGGTARWALGGDRTPGMLEKPSMLQYDRDVGCMGEKNNKCGQQSLAELTTHNNQKPGKTQMITTEKWISITCSICTIECYPAINWGEVLLCAATWMNCEYILLREKSQTEKTIPYDSIYMKYPKQVNKCIETDNQLVAAGNLGDGKMGSDHFLDKGFPSGGVEVF